MRIVPCAIQEVTVYLFYIHQCVYVNPKLPVYLCSKSELPWQERQVGYLLYTSVGCKKAGLQAQKTACETVKRDPMPRPERAPSWLSSSACHSLHARFLCSRRHHIVATARSTCVYPFVPTGNAGQASNEVFICLRSQSVDYQQSEP